jgi:uncharacterized OB-fold protein
VSAGSSASPGAEARVPYVRAVDPLPLESAEHNKLHAFYAHLGEGRLTTTRCRGCGRIDWPPRAFCPACTSDAFDWEELPPEGRIHGFSVQETGVPAGFPRPLVFAIVEVSGLRVFAPLTRVGDPGRLAIGARVRLTPIRVADDPAGQPRYLPAFTPAFEAR